MEYIDLTGIAIAVQTVIFGIIVRFLIPWIKANTTEKEQKIFTEIVRVGIGAVEELARTGVIPKCEKYNRLVEYLNENGYDLDEDAIRFEIHGNLWEMINQFKSDYILGSSEENNADEGENE